jgi:hypothetical protein|tara:strand:+ start:242 stop:403 length:162 start_codon:yes stop_codon:yes gene_type:complete
VKIKQEDIKKINSKIRRDEFCQLKNDRDLSTLPYKNKKKYYRKKKHKNNEESI